MAERKSFASRRYHPDVYLLKRLAVNAGGGDGPPAYPVLPGPQLVHPLGGEMGLDAVLDGLRLLFRFGNQVLELPQLPALALQFGCAHDVLSFHSIDQAAGGFCVLAPMAF